LEPTYVVPVDQITSFFSKRLPLATPEISSFPPKALPTVLHTTLFTTVKPEQGASGLALAMELSSALWTKLFATTVLTVDRAHHIHAIIAHIVAQDFDVVEH
jgi:hypothetical protein